MVGEAEADHRGMQLGKYELGRTLGEGNFGKVKFARHLDSGQAFAVKILDKKKILQLKIDDQVGAYINTFLPRLSTSPKLFFIAILFIRFDCLSF